MLPSPLTPSTSSFRMLSECRQRRRILRIETAPSTSAERISNNGVDAEVVIERVIEEHDVVVEETVAEDREQMAIPGENTTRQRRRRRRWLDSTSSLVLLLMCIGVAATILPVAAALKCYCTDDHCEPFGACDGPVCLVGILRESNQVIRTCGTRPLGCFRDDDERWSDLCACDEPFCNSFSYLRANTRREQDHLDALTGNGGERGEPRTRGHRDPMGDDHMGDHLVFHRMDRPDDSIMPGPDAPLSTRGSFLTLLLVVVPLTVGAATVLVVAFNYYCHLC